MIAEKKKQYRRVEDILNDVRIYIRKKYPDIYSEIMREMYEKYHLLPEYPASYEKNIGLTIEDLKGLKDVIEGTTQGKLGAEEQQALEQALGYITRPGHSRMRITKMEDPENM